MTGSTRIYRDVLKRPDCPIVMHYYEWMIVMLNDHSQLGHVTWVLLFVFTKMLRSLQIQLRLRQSSDRDQPIGQGIAAALGSLTPSF
jgi:hypothetical protein